MKLKKNKYIAFVFVRGGSVGIKNKNLQKIGKKSLLEITLDISKKIFHSKDIYVSTDSAKIKLIAVKNGVNVIDRPKKLSGNNSLEWKAWQHAIKHVSKKKSFNTFISLPVVSPLKSIIDIKKGMKIFEKNYKKIDGVIGINDAKKNPWFNMVTKAKNLVKLANYSKNRIYNRQSAPIIYEINTVMYLMKTNFILSKSHYFDGKIIGVNVPYPRNIDIDDKNDLEIARYFYNKKNK